MSKVRWGILGPGVIAHQFAKDIQYVDHAELIAVASRDAGRAESFAKRHDIPMAMRGYASLFNSSEVDAVYVATPHTFHVSQSIAAMQHGKAVLCEKPIATSPTDAQKLMDTASTTGQFAMEGMWTYFLPAIRQAVAWVNEGRIGELLHVKADFGQHHPFDPDARVYHRDLAGGCLLDMGIYPLALTWLFHQQLPDEIATTAHMAPNGVDDEISAQMRYPGQKTATISSSFRTWFPNWAYVIGSEGYISIPDFWEARECMLYQKRKMVDHFEHIRRGGGFEFQIAAASQCILDGQSASDLMPLSTSMKLQQLISMVGAQI